MDSHRLRQQRRVRATWLVLIAAGIGLAALAMLTGHGDLADPDKRDAFLRLRA